MPLFSFAIFEETTETLQFRSHLGPSHGRAGEWACLRGPIAEATSLSLQRGPEGLDGFLRLIELRAYHARMKIGFIGLGAMGFPMARHLAREHEVIIWNRTREKAERHAREHGSHLANDIADTAGSDVIITMLPTSREVDEIVDRLLPHVKPGLLW